MGVITHAKRKASACSPSFYSFQRENTSRQICCRLYRGCKQTASVTDDLSSKSGHVETMSHLKITNRHQWVSLQEILGGQGHSALLTAHTACGCLPFNPMQCRSFIHHSFIQGNTLCWHREDKPRPYEIFTPIKVGSELISNKQYSKAVVQPRKK